MSETSQVATLSARPPRSVLMAMSERYGMEPAAFEQTLRATVVPPNCTKEQFAAFLLVAKQYELNPITKEIYAFPTQRGGIQPIVSIDGWMHIINSQPELDGLEFEDILDEHKALLAIRCRIHRKDRAKPTEVIEYMSECRRDTPTWKQWPARMLRHKAAIQCARYAFGFSGIADPDEYERGNFVPPIEEKPTNGATAVNKLEAFAAEAEVEEAEVVQTERPKKKGKSKDEPGMVYAKDESTAQLNVLLDDLQNPMAPLELVNLAGRWRAFVFMMIPAHQKQAQEALYQRNMDILGADDDWPTFLPVDKDD